MTHLSITGKILARMLLDQLIPIIAEENLPACFRANRGTVDMIFVLRQLQGGVPGTGHGPVCSLHWSEQGLWHGQPRRSLASSSFDHPQHRVWQNHSPRLITKVKVYVAVVISTFLYAAIPKVHTAPGTLPPEVPALHHGNTLAGLHHQRWDPTEGWSAKYQGYAAISTSPLGRDV